MRRRSIKVLAFIAILAVPLLNMPPAFAYYTFPYANGTCDSGDFCVWHHDNAGGGIGDTPNAVANYNGYGYYGTAVGINDSVSSVRNRFKSYAVRLYEHNTYRGISQCFSRNMAAAYTNVGAIEDKGSSHKGIGTNC